MGRQAFLSRLALASAILLLLSVFHSSTPLLLASFRLLGLPRLIGFSLPLLWVKSYYVARIPRPRKIHLQLFQSPLRLHQSICAQASVVSTNC